MKAYQYPWRSNNQFQLLIDGTLYFSSMLDEIKRAKSLILFEAYLFQSGETADNFINELCSAKERGVEIFVILDEYGSKSLNEVDKNKLTHAGIELLLYNPTSFFHISTSLKRDHRKLLIIDNDVAFIGGAGITDKFTPSITLDYWHDVMLKIKGDIIFDLIHSFKKIWEEQKQTSLIPLPDYKLIKEITHQAKNKARILIAEGTDRHEINRAIVSHIRSSTKQVWLTSPYFISSWKIRRALRHAAKKGVDVRLIFPGPHSDHQWVTHGTRRYYQRLLKSKVAIYEYQPRFTHSKIMLCDDWFTIGSSNLDRWNQFLNLDANIEVYDEQSHQQIINLFSSDFSQSTLITLQQWNMRSSLQHIKEWISGIVINCLGYISRKFKR